MSRPSWIRRSPHSPLLLDGADRDPSRQLRTLSGRARAELRRVYLRETARLLWEAAFRAAGVEDGLVRGKRSLILDPELECASAESLFEERVVAWENSCSQAWFELLSIDAPEWEEGSRGWDDRERLSLFVVAGLLERACDQVRADWDLAFELALRAVQLSSGTTDLRRWAIFLRADGSPGRAREVLRRGLDESLGDGSDSSVSAEILTDLARLEAVHGAPRTARELLEEANRLDASKVERGFDGLGLALQLSDADLLEGSLRLLRRDPRGALRCQSRAARRWEAERVDRLPWRADSRLLNRMEREPEPVRGLIRAFGQPTVLGEVVGRVDLQRSAEGPQ